MTTGQINDFPPLSGGAAVKRAFHRRLRRWYACHGRRDLPWRHTDDAYAIYVSEIMLQQTQVATVRDRFYAPFLKRFPTLSSLAAASRRDVLRAWQGLGYYNRAIHLHETAKRCGGELPVTIDALMALPGIGRNTAHAIAALAYRRPVAVMEANVKRVLARLFALTTPSDKELWEKAQALVDGKNPFDYNQAMMDLGALVCTRRRPRCGACPAGDFCLGRSSPESYPAAKKKKAVPVRRKSIVVLRDAHGRYFARPRQGRFLNGLYHFVEAPAGARHINLGKRHHALARATRLGRLTQQYSHFTLEADIRLLRVPAASGRHWHTLAQLKGLPFSAAEQKILARLKP